MVIRSMELMGSSPAATATAPVTAMPQLEYFDTGYSGGEMSLELVTVWQLSRCGERQQADRAKLKKKFIKALRGSEPIVPKHQPPKSIGESVPSLVRREDRLFFDDFRDFGTVVNWCLADEHVGGPWRLQELPNTDLSLNFSHMPDFGRRYDIFYNQVPLGTLEVSPGVATAPKNPSSTPTLIWTGSASSQSKPFAISFMTSHYTSAMPIRALMDIFKRAYLSTVR